jgi:hypothetical protein
MQNIIHPASHTRLGLWLALLASLVLCVTPKAVAQANANPPANMTFQGFLTDASSPPVPLGNTSPVNKDITFKIYDNATNGTVKWAESQIVTVDKGHFSVLLGVGTPGDPHPALPDVFTGSDASERWLGITVDGAEITPRIQFFAAPYAQLARAANKLTDAATTENVTVEGRLQANGNVVVSGDLTANNLSLSGNVNNSLSVSGRVNATGMVESKGNEAGFYFFDRSTTSPTNDKWAWYSNINNAYLYYEASENTGNKITVNPNGNLMTVGQISGNSISSTTSISSATVSSTSHVTTPELKMGATFGDTKISLWDNGTDAFGLGIADGTFRLHLGNSSSKFSFYDKKTGGNEILTLKGTGEMELKGLGNLKLVTDTSNSDVETGVLTLDGKNSGRGGHIRIKGGGNLYVTSGKIGIGQAAPRAPLHVGHFTSENKFSLNEDTAYGVYLGSQGYVMDPNGGSEQDKVYVSYGTVSAIFDQDVVCRRVWAGDGLQYSDARAKKVIGVSDSNRDLQLLRNLEIRDYTWIDRSVDNHTPQKKLIAQEVEKVFPQAVSIAPKPTVIPNVYQLAESVSFNAEKKELHVIVDQAHDFQAGDRIDLYTNDQSLQDVTVLSVKGEREFIVACERAPESVFVYGKYVSDFRSVDYDAIAMLNVSATQELARQHEALQKRVSELEAREQHLADLEKRVKQVDAMEQQVAELKKLVVSLLKEQSAPDALASLDRPVIDKK